MTILSNPNLAKRSEAEFARLLQHTRRALPKVLALGLICSLTGAASVAGPDRIQNQWSQIFKTGSGNQPGYRNPLSSPVHGSATLLLAPTQAVLGETGLLVGEPFHYDGKPVDYANAAECLAAAAWYEVGSDPSGQRAVIQTVINRVNHPRFPNSVCGVVFQGSERRTGCQFTFTCDGSLQRRHPPTVAWKSALARAEDALNGFVDKEVGTATHYHAFYVNPWWSRKLERLTSVGPHIFYRWFGDKSAFKKGAHLVAEQDFNELARRSAWQGKTVEQRVAQPSDQGLLSAMPIPPLQLSIASVMPVGNAIYLPVESDKPNGSWALAAMNACKGRGNCQVFGYGDMAAIERNQKQGLQDRDRPIFLFLRDAASAMNIALWDCQRVERPQASECMPIDRRALLSLMRERY